MTESLSPAWANGTRHSSLVRVRGACRGLVQNVFRGSGEPRPAQNEFRVGGACGPPPPVAAPLVPRCALPCMLILSLGRLRIGAT